jgi:hypothetical protein
MASSVINSDDGVISGTSGLKSSGGDDGNLVFQSKGTETARINTDKQIVAAAGTASLPALTTTGDVNTGIFFPAADTIAFAEGGAEAMRIGSNGNVSVNSTDTSYAKFVSRGTGSYAVVASDPSFSVLAYNEGDANDTSDVFFVGRGGTDYTGFSGTNRIIIWSNGNVVNTNNSYGAISDVKLKQDIVDAGSQWDDIKSLRVRKFHWKSEPDGFMQIGLVAQEAEQVSPGLIDESPDYEEVEITDEDGNVKTERNALGTVTKSVKYSVLYMKAVKALQEAMDRIETLEAKNDALEARIAALEQA